MRLGKIYTNNIRNLTGTLPTTGQVLTYNGTKITWSTGGNGNQGNQGNQGYQGYQGNEGNQGNQGVQGHQGFGYQGYQGIQGDQGNQGYQGNGIQGNQGYQGVPGIGSQGHQGHQGFQGFQGNQGYQGYDGNQGNQGTQGTPYTLPTATAGTLGGVKIGSGINVTGDGTISTSGTGIGSVIGCETFSFASSVMVYNAGNQSNGNQGPYYSAVVIPISTFTVNTMKVLCTQGGGNAPCRLGIYDINTLHGGVYNTDGRLAQTEVFYINGPGLQTGTITGGYQLTAGVPYAFAFQILGNGNWFLFYSGVSTIAPYHTGRVSNSGIILDGSTGMIQNTGTMTVGTDRIWIGAYT